MPSKSVFISHIAEEAEVANTLKLAVQQVPSVQAFSSSADIGLGAQWLAQIDKALHQAGVILVLCSNRSVERRWINFETGAGWGRKKPVIPLCYGRMTTADLPDPLKALQALDLHGAADCRQLIQRICESLKCEVPAEIDYSAMAASLNPRAPARQPVIALDVSHGQSGWDASGRSIYQAGETGLPPWNFLGIQSPARFLSKEFQQASGLIVGSPWRARMAPDSIDLVRRWVLEGGRLLLLGYELGDLHHDANLGQLGSPFGVSFSTDLVGPPDYGPLKPYGVPVKFRIGDADSHPFVDGLESVTLSNVQTVAVAPGGVEWLRVGPNVVYRPSRKTVDYRGGTLIQPVSKECDRNSGAAWVPVAVEAPRGLTGAGAVCAIGTWQIMGQDPGTTLMRSRLFDWLSGR